MSLKRSSDTEFNFITPKKVKYEPIISPITPNLSPITPITPLTPLTPITPVNLFQERICTPTAPKKSINLKYNIETFNKVVASIFEQIELFNSEGIMGEKLVTVLEETFEYVHRIMKKDGPYNSDEKYDIANLYSPQCLFYIDDLCPYGSSTNITNLFYEDRMTGNENEISSIVIDANSFYKLFKGLEVLTHVNDSESVRNAFNRGVKIYSKIVNYRDIDLSFPVDKNVLFIVAERQTQIIERYPDNIELFAGRSIDSVPKTMFNHLLQEKKLSFVDVGNNTHVGKRCLHCAHKVVEPQSFIQSWNSSMLNNLRYTKYFVDTQGNVICAPCLHEYALSLDFNKISRIN